MNNLKKVFLVTGCCVLSLTLFSFKSVDANEVNLVNTTKIVNQQGNSSLAVSNQAARITALVRGAKKLWNASGKEAAKFVAYEIVLRGIDYIVAEELQVADIALKDEMNRKLNNL
jgi:hypothetical protein